MSTRITGRFLILAFALVLCPALVAWADSAPADKSPAPPLLMLAQMQPTHPEHILMIFDKIAGIEPDFAALAGKSPFLNKAKEVDRDSIINRENNRLRQTWADLDSSQPIVVHTSVNLANYSTINEQLTLPEFNPKTFFSFAIYGENIAIVPKDIARFSKIPLTRQQMDEILKKTTSTAATAELILKPAVADAKTPFVHDGKSYWLMLAEIGEIRLWAGKEGDAQLLWMHRADWYKPKEDTSLLNLKSGM
ncbi:MAG: hypothetical protein H6865_03045 [Rhodospirillales bacterium]|nr:hypothetical protein [Alphaproteobacteria bacterium]MCB9986594.1 hypothetical protein [Rhodospirillales bacterium]USO06876.1 MAG: hypothetical protein H6866_05340 [Rhodospirillales bacterium]